MKYLLILCILAAACSSARKSANQQKQEVNKYSYSITDSIGSSSIDSSSENGSISWITTTTDSGYDKVTEEEVKEVIDSNVIHRHTKRIIKEKGQKRTEQSSVNIQKDSTGKQAQQNSIVKQFHNEDSSIVNMTKSKYVNRTTFLPWWLWIIASIIGLLVWIKRNSIIDFFT